jgi:hypothetical protein
MYLGRTHLALPLDRSRWAASLARWAARSPGVPEPRFDRSLGLASIDRRGGASLVLDGPLAKGAWEAAHRSMIARRPSEALTGQVIRRPRARGGQVEGSFANRSLARQALACTTGLVETLVHTPSRERL